MPEKESKDNSAKIRRFIQEFSVSLGENRKNAKNLDR